MNLSGNRLRSWLRAIHRDLGYFVVGMTLVYAISGILLNHRDGGNPSVGKEEIIKQFPSQLSKEDFSLMWEDELSPYKINAIINENGNYKIYTDGGSGNYNLETGSLTLTFFHKRPFFEFINKLHYNQKAGWTFFADFFAVALIALVVSGLFIVKGRRGFLKRGVWFMSLGVLVILAYLWV
jgi:hypothetical protein